MNVVLFFPLTPQTFQSLLFAFLADDEEQRDTQRDQDDRRADGEEFLHVVTFASG